MMTPHDTEAISWIPAPEHPCSSLVEVHVWRAALTRPECEVATLRKLLTDDEVHRADRFRFERDRSYFIVARGVLRMILGRYLGQPPARLLFEYNSFGKPKLSGVSERTSLRFNLSHAGGLALYAVAEGREVGIDIERVREDFAGPDIARRFFSSREAATLCALPADVRTRAFFECWTRKEAYIKARGMGLSLPLSTFDVSLSPGEPAALLCTRDDPREASRWPLRELEPGLEYVAAVAVEGGGWRLRCWDWHH